MIAVTCSKCLKSLQAKPEFAGKRVRCPDCSAVIQIPQQGEAPPELPDEPLATRVADSAAAALSVIGSKLTSALNAKETPSPSPPSTIINASSKIEASLFERLTSQKQDPAIVEKVVERITGILTEREEILCIAVQQRPVVNLFPDCLVLTTRRIVLYHAKILGRVDFEDYIWREVKDVRLQENVIGSTISFTTIGRHQHSLDYLPKDQARAVYRIAQEREQWFAEERRLRDLEAARALSGGTRIVNQIPIPNYGHAPGLTSDGAMARLQQLKQLLEAGLLTQEEYDQKRAALVAQI